jgi:hypothetical protein
VAAYRIVLQFCLPAPFRDLIRLARLCSDKIELFMLKVIELGLSEAT